MASTTHYLALRPCIELLSIGENTMQSVGGQTVLIPRGMGSTIFPTSSLELLRIGEQFELQRNQSRTVSTLLLLTSGGLVVYLLYKNCTSDDNSDSNESNQRRKPKWSAQSWIRWLLFGDTPDLRGQYFGPMSSPQHKFNNKQLLRKSGTPVSIRGPGNNLLYVSPCPNCIRGICKIRKHHQMMLRGNKNLQFMPLWERDSPSTSGSLTPVRITTEMKLSPRGAESADDESSGDESTPTQKSTPSKKVRKGRIPPEGRERAAKNNYDGSYLSSMTRDEESMDSICGVTGSMVDLVKGAREVRRLIREASFDSLASEFSLDISIHEGVGSQTASHFDSLCHEIDNLKENCDHMSEKLDFSDNNISNMMKSSKSDYQFSKESTPDPTNVSSPDLRNLHKIIHTAPAKNKALWTLTHNTGFSDNDSTYSPIHRDMSESPSFHDPKENRYKVVLSSNTSECGGDFEWDSEGLVCDASGINPELNQVYHHDTWLQDDIMELDLEAELLSSTFNRCRNSRESSVASEIDASGLYNKIRLPPSGRSSVMEVSHGNFNMEDYDLTKSMSLSGISRSSSLNSFKEYSNNRKHKRSPCESRTSDESGIENDKSASSCSISSRPSTTSADYSSMISSVTTPLSPVHEVRESPKHTPSPYYTSSSTSSANSSRPSTAIKQTPKTTFENTKEKIHSRRRIL